MSLGLVGKKCGMTRVFNADGTATPVTVIEVSPNRVTRVKSDVSDGYSALQVTFGGKKSGAVNKAEAGEFAKAGVEAGIGLLEFRLAEGQLGEFKVGDQLTVAMFAEGQFVDVSGVSKGKGYQGTVKRWNFRTQDATHGNSLSHRAPGSIGQRQTPGRVFKGKKMSGHMGADNVTVQSLQVVKVDADRNLILVKGAVPGAAGNKVVVYPAVKA
jgi:large subunit ribosomal protein L3